MAPKRIPPPPSSLSSEEDKDVRLVNNEDVEEEEEESSSDDERTSIKEGQSEEEEEEEDESDSDSESDSDLESGKSQYSPTVSDFTIKPIASKPMVDSTKNKKLVKGKVASTSTVVVAKPPAKRELEVENCGSKDSVSKRVKVSNGNVGEKEEKRAGVNRLWSDEDEIAILQGLIDYRLQKGADPNAEMGVFLEFIKDSLHVDVSKLQLSDKIRRLKKKYQTIVEKSGEDPVFSKPHDCKSFELLKKIWGKGGVVEAGSVNGAKSDSGQAKRSRSKVSHGSAAWAKVKDEGKAIVLKVKTKDKAEIVEGKAFVAKDNLKANNDISEGKAVLKVKTKDKAEIVEGKAFVAKDNLKAKNDVSEGKAIMTKEKPKGTEEMKVVNGDFAEMYPYLNSALDKQWEAEPFRALSEEARRSMKETIGRNKKAQELNEGFKMLVAKELEVYLTKLELTKETAGMFLSGMISEK